MLFDAFLFLQAQLKGEVKFDIMFHNSDATVLKKVDTQAVAITAYASPGPSEIILPPTMVYHECALEDPVLEQEALCCATFSLC